MPAECCHGQADDRCPGELDRATSGDFRLAGFHGASPVIQVPVATERNACSSLWMTRIFR